MIKLPKASFHWAFKHVMLQGDNDLLPRPFEMSALKFNHSTTIDALVQIDIGSYHWHGGRRFVVPKGELSFRTATQLDPVDSLVLAAIVKKYGRLIERARIPLEQARVFSYRFDPSDDGRFYGAEGGWQEFWQACIRKLQQEEAKWIALADVADYYNQVYHHTLENQLAAAGVPAEITKGIMNLLKTLTERVSRGIPVGPHSTHILAECAFNPIDRSLLSNGQDFCRYVDDVHFFCRSKEDAEVALYQYADAIDRQQRLTLQDSKTEVLPAEEYLLRAQRMLLDQPLNHVEEEILRAIVRAAGGDPYDVASLTSLTDEELHYFDQEKLEALFDLYLSQDPVPYSRLGWLLRRLSQVRAPGGMIYLLKKLSIVRPILGDVARYILSASENFDGDWDATGSLVVDALRQPLVAQSPYVQLVLLNLFSRVPQLNHIDRLTALYRSLSPEAQREVITAASAAGKPDWVRERKVELHDANAWVRRAIIAATAALPPDEATAWINQVRRELGGLEKLVARWAFRNRAMSVGEIKLTA